MKHCVKAIIVRSAANVSGMYILHFIRNTAKNADKL